MEWTTLKNKNMIKPIRDLILVKPFESDSVSTGGIILSEAHREVSNKVKVVAVGNGTKKHPMRFKGGETGFRIKNSGEEIIIDGEKHYLLNQNWIIGLLN